MSTKTRLVALCAIFVPAVAAAQPAPDTTNPNEPQPPPPQAPAQPEPPAPPPQPSTVVVNPPPPPTVVAPSPSSEEVYDAWNAPVFASGAIVFAGSYGAAVVAAAASNQDQLDRGNRRLYVPVAGPWLALNDRSTNPCPITEARCDSSTTVKVLLIADGVFQAAGIITMVTGLMQPTHHSVVVRQAKLDTKVHVTPTVVGSDGSPGIAMFGNF